MQMKSPEDDDIPYVLGLGKLQVSFAYLLSLSTLILQGRDWHV